jgi:prefoldin subunit 5
MDVSGKFVISLPKTEDLSPPDLVCEWEAGCDGADEFDKVLVAYFAKNYESGLKDIMEAQCKAFAVPLKSMQEEIDDIKKEVKSIQALTDVQALLEATQAFEKKHKKDLDTLVKEYNKYLEDAVDNVRRQQLRIYGSKFEDEALAYAKKKVKSDVKKKEIRQRVGVVIRGTLTVSALVAGVLATVATFGLAAPALAAVGAVIFGMGGLSKIGRTALDVKDMWNAESHSLNVLNEQLESLQQQLEQVDGKRSSLFKHIDDVSAQYSKRRLATEAISKEVDRLDADITKLESQMSRLKGSHAALHASLTKQVDKLRKSLILAMGNHEKANRRDAELRAALEKAKELVGDLNKIPFERANSVVDVFKRLKPTNAKEGLDLADSIIETIDNAAGMAG